MNTKKGQESGILRDTIASLQNTLGDQLDAMEIERIVIGIFFTGVKLNNGHGGLCFTPIKTIPEAVCCPSSAKAMPNSGKIKGTKVTKILDNMFYGNAMKRSIGIAVMNALSNTVWAMRGQNGHVIQKGADPLDDYVFPEGGKAVVVGALVPYLRMLKNQNRDFCILEKDVSTLKPDELPRHVPEERAHEKVAEADLLIITGTTLLNDTLEGLLDAAKPGADIFVVGPTASMLPGAFFDRGVTSIGGVTVTKPDLLLDILAEAGSGYHFFGKSADKVVIARP
ncbi:DUF364 domain-containing protein [Desulfolutivibrio sulfoxidireducens]|uniref:DUF364 domain-containing protein n=1 Tax=Desulfolutivibrio sulfoxidireducens TaxID=2773299 RepID=UPI00159E4695|nr:DUF364 domain-containing protein [Desulfolutivibrio sulfoxidireducens]QLA19384.1 Fis family transcriptional regulator [Desulfolutivibrio sulfoxidireducens]